MKPAEKKTVTGPWPDLAMAADFLRKLPGHLRRRRTPDASRRELGARLMNRERNFLALLGHAVFANPSSPYLPLFREAGCEMGDVAGLVSRQGLEGALLSLFKAGIHLSVDAFKGRSPARLGSARVMVSPDSLRNPGAGSHLALKSGGSRSAGTGVVFDLDFIEYCSLDTALALQARGGEDWLKASWEVPGGGALFSLLELAKCGSAPLSWFSQIDPRAKGLHPRYRYSAWLLLLGGLMAGRVMPRPKHVPLGRPEPIARWMAGSLARGMTPYLLTYPSNALKVCRAAEELGIDLSGARFTIAGEPCTEVRMAVIRRTGAQVMPKYGIMETGPVGYGCQNPVAPDEVHLLSDLHAMIQPGDDAGDSGLPTDALLFTSLSPAAPIFLLNVSMGDQAVLKQRDCGCELHKLGWTTHLWGIKSFEKLTVGGMNFSDQDIIKVLDEDLPRRFGGGPTDYQVAELEGEDGEAGLKLVVSPGVGEIDEDELVRTFFAGLGRGPQVNRVMSLAWREGLPFQVERREPLATPSGKILHLHQGTKK